MPAIPVGDEGAVHRNTRHTLDARHLLIFCDYLLDCPRCKKQQPNLASVECTNSVALKKASPTPSAGRVYWLLMKMPWRGAGIRWQETHPRKRLLSSISVLARQGKSSWAPPSTGIII